ncbi:hypothetical protein GCM10010464_20850 [Pseudonocardia yunnanensis]|uniref:Methionine synthase n=1 Tax=Pseudonocardia yunnanensis TaxID=58107 RepID=A0ABW4ETZ8_9PSEU
MTSTAYVPRVHLVGSIPLENSEAALRTAATLGSGIARIPDGETGERSNWIRWQHSVFTRNTQFSETRSHRPQYSARNFLTVAPGVAPDDVAIGPLGYAKAAVDSYQVFVQLRSEGIIPAATRFQVGLPTPVGVVINFFEPAARPLIEGPYQTALRAELETILAAIPGPDLAIQWEVVWEFAMIEGWLSEAEWWGADTFADIIDRLVSLGNAIPPEVELGFHLCYGDANHKHFMEPTDTRAMRDVANAVRQAVHRKVDWVHMPVPRGRADVDYFAPLSELDLDDDTELYLGLIHLTDGVPGANRRIASARSAVSGFGLATECGFGRRPPESIRQLLAIHRDLLTAAHD